jgi:hypothetical protein
MIKILYIFCIFFLPINSYSQIQTTIDIVGSYDFVNTVFYNFGFFVEGRGNRTGHRFGINYNFRVSDNIMFKTGLRYSKQGHRSGFFVVDIDTPEHFIILKEYTDEYYIEIPVEFRYELGNGKLGSYMEFGISPHYYIEGKFSTSYTVNNTSTNYEIPYLEDRRIRIAYVVGFGLNYRVFKTTQFFIQPTFRYYPSLKSAEPRPAGEVLHTRNAGIEFGVRHILNYVDENNNRKP